MPQESVQNYNGHITGCFWGWEDDLGGRVSRSLGPLSRLSILCQLPWEYPLLPGDPRLFLISQEMIELFPRVPNNTHKQFSLSSVSADEKSEIPLCQLFPTQRLLASWKESILWNIKWKVQLMDVSKSFVTIKEFSKYLLWINILATKCSKKWNCSLNKW